jgi:hypothetical protein
MLHPSVRSDDRDLDRMFRRSTIHPLGRPVSTSADRQPEWADLHSFGADDDFSAVPVSVGVVTTLSGSAPPDVWW